MDAIDKKILNNYLGLLERLNPTMKLKLIDRLTESVKSRVSSIPTIKSAFGAWNPDESAEELIEAIRKSRNTKSTDRGALKFLIDTNICIYYMKGKFGLDNKFETISPDSIFISEITLAELKFGVANSATPERNNKAIRCSDPSNF